MVFKTILVFFTRMKRYERMKKMDRAGQSVLCILRFHTWGFNQPQVENIWKNNVTLLLMGTMQLGLQWLCLY